MFQSMFSPIIRSTLLYLQYLVVFTQVAAGTSRQQLGRTLPDTAIQSSAPDDGRKIDRNMYSRLGIINESI